MKIVEVNEIDIYGKIFNGYDIAEYYTGTKDFEINQLVLNKLSDAPFVKSIFPNGDSLNYKYNLKQLEHNILSVHSLLSISSGFLYNNNDYINSDLVHYHQFHNSNFGFFEFMDQAKLKPTVITLHDPWFLTGRCVHPGHCNKWQNGCKKCDNLDTLFDLPRDNCNELWKIKESVVKNSDLDIIVSSDYMMNMVKQNPYLKNEHIHLLPFGINTNKYNFELSKETAKEKLGIDPDSIVIFCREAVEKGITYLVDALNDIEVNQKIVILTCSQKGLMSNLKDDYKLIEMGNLDELGMLDCYNASDIFAMPSLGESFGMMAVEAMASSLPVVIFDNTALPSITFAPEIGVLVKNKDSKDLKEKLEMLINDRKLRIKLGDEGRKKVSEYYSVEKYYNKLKSIYHEAYDRQKYKIKKLKTNRNNSINYKNENVQKLLIELKKIYTLYLPNNELPKMFNYIIEGKTNDNAINYSDEEVKKLITLFNSIIYKDTKKIIDNPSLKVLIKRSKIYNGLKSIKVLRKFVLLIKGRNQKYIALENRINDLSSQNIILHNNIKKLEQKISENSRKTTEDLMIFYGENIGKVEESFNLQNELLEYNFNTYNDLTNKLLYQELLKKSEKKKRFNPLVSIIIPVYNGSKYVKEAIESALNQTYKNIEIIVVNDGSDDNGATANIVTSYNKKLKYYEKENGGVSSALNFGIKKMKGDYFAWLSHDDLIDIDHIERLVEFYTYFSDDEYIPYTNFKIIDQYSNVDYNATINAQINCSDFKTTYLKNYYALLCGEINGGSVLLPRKIFDEVGYFDENLRITQERDMWSRIIPKYKFINIPYDTASIRIHKDQVTKVNKSVIDETNKKNLDIIKSLSEKDILGLESNIDYFYTKMYNFYKYENNKYMAEEIKKISKEKGGKDEKKS